MEEENKERRKNDVLIAERLVRIETLLNNGIREELKSIKKQVNNDLPHQIAGVKKYSDDEIKVLSKNFMDYQINQHKWTIGIFVSLAFLLGGIILNIVIK